MMILPQVGDQVTYRGKNYHIVEIKMKGLDVELVIIQNEAGDRASLGRPAWEALRKEMVRPDKAPDVQRFGLEEVKRWLRDNDKNVSLQWNDGYTVVVAKDEAAQVLFRLVVEAFATK